MCVCVGGGGGGGSILSRKISSRMFTLMTVRGEGEINTCCGVLILSACS